MKTLALMALFSGFAFAGNGSATITLTTSPQALYCGTNPWANHVEVSVIPGGTGKVFVGMSTMNSSTYSGVARILFPNGGAHSEFFKHSDPASLDTINLCNLYVMGAVAGEIALVSWTYVAGTPTGNELVLANAGANSSTNAGLLRNSAWYANYPNGTGSCGSSAAGQDPYYYFAKIHMQVIPGQSGKLTLRYSNGITSKAFHELYPNSGTLSQHSAWSEGWELQTPDGQNGIRYYQGLSGNGRCQQPFVGWSGVPQVSGEKVLTSMWQLQASGAVVDPPRYFGFSVNSGAWMSTPGLYDAGGASQKKIRVIPGNCDKLYIGNLSLNTTTGTGTYKILFPNCYGGWSEEATLSSLHNKDTAHINDLIASTTGQGFSTEELGLFGGPGGFGPNVTGISGGMLTWSTTPVALGTAYKHRVQISIIPGLTGKVYLGNAAMNTSTMSGVFAVLFPNSVGNWSEEFDLVDPLGDGIDTSTIYVLGDQSGGWVGTSFETTGVTPGTPLSLTQSGIYTSGATSATLLNAASTPVSVLRTQVLPGESGKVRVGTSAMTGTTQPDSAFGNTVRVLWPNTGSYSVGEGFSETFKVRCRDGSNCADLNGYSLFTEVAGEHLVVGAWSH